MSCMSVVTKLVSYLEENENLMTNITFNVRLITEIEQKFI